MSLKKTDLAKNLGLKISMDMKKAGVPGRFGEASRALPDRREQRKLDQAAGLMPFAIKLHHDLIKQLQEQAQAQGVSLNEWADRVIRAGLGTEAGGVQISAKEIAQDKAPEKSPAKKAAVKQATVEQAAAKKAAAKKAPQADAGKAPAKKTLVAKKAASNKGAVSNQTVAVKAAAKRGAPKA